MLRYYRAARSTPCEARRTSRSGCWLRRCSSSRRLLFGTGVVLLALDQPHGTLVGLHKASFLVWAGAFGLHVLGHLLRLPQLWRRRVPGLALRVASPERSRDRSHARDPDAPQARTGCRITRRAISASTATMAPRDRSDSTGSRPHEPGEPARHVAELASSLASRTRARTSGATSPARRDGATAIRSRRRRSSCVAGTLSMYLGEPPERRRCPRRRPRPRRARHAASNCEPRRRGASRLRVRHSARERARGDPRLRRLADRNHELALCVHLLKLV